jgi:hypothetical protein
MRFTPRRARGLLLVASASALALVGVSAAPGLLEAVAVPAASSMKLGFIDQGYATRDPAGYVADLGALHASVVRDDAFWQRIAPTRPAHPRDPRDPAYRFAELDAQLRTAARYGHADILITIWGTPPWARWAPAAAFARAHNASGNQQVIPDPQAAGDFAYAIARRYSGTFADPLVAGARLPLVRWFEINDEPNLANGMYPQCMPAKSLRGKGSFPNQLSPTFRCPRGQLLVAPRLYARQLTASYRAIHSASNATGARQRVLGGALANHHTKSFLRELRRLLGPNPPWDAISIHPYNDDPEAGVDDHPVGDGVAIGNFPSFIRLVDQLWPRKRYRIWVSEYGWQTWPDEIVGVAPSDHAAFLAAAIPMFRRTGRVDALINYLIVDEQIGPGRLGVSWQSGLRFFNGDAKPAFDVWARLARPSPVAARR